MEIAVKLFSQVCRVKALKVNIKYSTLFSGLFATDSKTVENFQVRECITVQGSQNVDPTLAQVQTFCIGINVTTRAVRLEMFDIFTEFKSFCARKTSGKLC